MAKLQAEFRTVTDRLGKTIDPLILDTVITLNALGIHTTSSCEGHLDWGIAGPWIEIGPADTTQIVELRKKYKTLVEQAEELEEQKKDFDNMKQLLEEARTVELEFCKPNLIQVEKVTSYLTEFYKQHQCLYDETIIIIDKGTRSRIQNAGTSLQRISPPDIRTANLKRYQNEMVIFSKFLKTNFVHIY